MIYKGKIPLHEINPECLDEVESAARNLTWEDAALDAVKDYLPHEKAPSGFEVSVDEALDVLSEENPFWDMGIEYQHCIWTGSTLGVQFRIEYEGEEPMLYVLESPYLTHAMPLDAETADLLAPNPIGVTCYDIPFWRDHEH